MAQVEIIVGSESDIEKIKSSEMFFIFDNSSVDWNLSVISCHRNPEELREYCNQTKEQTLVYIGIAGMAAALPGLISAYVRFKPVIGVALSSDKFDGMDALFPMIRMPSGCPVMVCGIDESGLENAAFSAVGIVSQTNHEVMKRFKYFLEVTRKSSKIRILSK